MAEFVYRHRKAIIAIFLAVTAVSVIFIPNLRFDGDITALAPRNVSSVVDFREVSELFGGADSLAVAVTSGALFTSEGLAAAAAVGQDLAALPDVADVISVFTYLEPVNGAEGLEFLPYIDPASIPADAAGIDALKGRLEGRAAVMGNLVSNDFSTLLLLAQTSAGASQIRLIEGVKEVMAAHGEFEFHLAGTPFIDSEMVGYMRKDVVSLVVFGLLAVLAVLYFGFRSLRGIVLPLFTIGSSLAVTFGLMGLLHARLTIVALIIPVMLIAICNNYAIHFLTRYYEDVQVNGLTDKVGLINSGFRSLSKPVWLAFVTTVASFLSFVTSPIPRIAEMGLYVAFGITFAFAMTMFFIPAAMAILPLPKHRESHQRNQAMIMNIADRIGRTLAGKRKAILVLGVVVVALGIFFIPRIVVDSELSNYFNPDSGVRKGIAFIDEKTGGSQVLELALPADPRTAQGLEVARAFQEYATSIESVGSVFSVVDSVKALNRVFHDDDPAFDTVPTDDETAAQLFLLVETSLSPERLLQLVSEDYSTMCLSIQLKSMDSTSVRKTADLLIEGAKRISGSGDARLAGVSLIAEELNGLVITSMLQSFALAFALVFGFVAFGFKNLVSGIVSSGLMVGIVLLVFGFMGAAGIELSTATALVASITLGVGIDYLIHFSARWYRERKSGADAARAAALTLGLTGKGIIINAVAILFAVLPTFFSQFRPIVYFGALCFISIGLSLAVALGFLPALLAALPGRLYESASPDA